MCANTDTTVVPPVPLKATTQVTIQSKNKTCTEVFGDTIESYIYGFFARLGSFVGNKPRLTIFLSILLTVLCGYGFTSWTTENRADKLWVPQNTIAEIETTNYSTNFPSTSRFNSIIVSTASNSVDSNNINNNQNVLTKEVLLDAMKMHNEIETTMISIESEKDFGDDGGYTGDSIEDVIGDYDLQELCTKAGGTCTSKFDGICTCLIQSILKFWNYNVDTLVNDTNVLATLNSYGNETRKELSPLLGNPIFDETTGQLLSAEAFTISYFLQDRSLEEVNTDESDPINEKWEKDVFLEVVQNSVPEKYPLLKVNYFASRSFSDEFGGAITGDLALVQVSYVVVFLFLGANMGTRITCGTGSRWTMSLAALVLVILSTGAGFGLSSIFGLFFGPVHSLLPFILLGIGVDDAFVIVNAFNRERKKKVTAETNEDITKRCSRGLARAGASITVTSMTDLVAFGISSSSSLPALASFCAYAAISIFFLWFFASTFFTATLVFDERRQRDNRRECCCCLTRKIPIDDGEDDDDDGEDDGNGGGFVYEEDRVSRYFRNYHAPAILSKVGKIIILIIFTGLLGFGFWGAVNLSVEDSERNFIPDGSYLTDYLNAADEYYPSTGIDLNIIFEDGTEIYNSRQSLAELDTRLSGKSTQSPYIAEPNSEATYRNVMAGLSTYLSTSGTAMIGNVELGEDGWPTNEADFVTTISQYASFTGPGGIYAQDVSYSDDRSMVTAIRIHSEYVRLTKIKAGEIIDDADRQIEAMDDTRDMIASWDDLPSNAYPYSDKFITIEGFKIIKRELFMNVALAIAAVGVIVFFTVASPVTSVLITLNVSFCIIEILGFMHAFGIIIDSVSVINIVLAVGLSIDYSAHVGHCFMVKGGTDKDQRALEALADIGAAVLNGAITTFLAVVVLLFSSSYVFEVLSRQFALTVALGITHGLILLPVLLSLFGPPPFTSAEESVKVDKKDVEP